jgi:SAM-dependent methyltransferase
MKKLEYDSDFESIMYEQTEWPGEQIPLDDLNIIAHRYNRSLELCVDADVLEIGSGSTIGKLELAEVVNSFVSIDISEKNILRSKALCQELGFQQYEADAHKLPFPDSTFDTVIALAMIYYLDSEIFLKEVRRVLRPGGKLFFCSSNKDVPGFVAAPGSHEYLSIPEWSVLLRSEGFKVGFEGVFTKPHALPLGLRSSLIRFIKAGLNCLGLSALWGRLRRVAKGPRHTIPEKLSDFPNCTEVSEPLDETSANASYRVIYCECERS